MLKTGLLAVGADPEVFLFRGTQAISAEGRIGGTKRDPVPMENLGEGFTKQEDNVAAEFNIPPAKTATEFDIAIGKALKHLSKQVATYALDIKCVPTATFTAEELMTPHAMELGCDPDFCAWTGQQNPRPRAPEFMRTAAGHVHISWTDPTPEEQALYIKYLDLFLGVPSILVTDANDRRKLYGKAGCYRPKPYGVEYRTLDNFWLPVKKYRRHIFSTIQSAFPALTSKYNHWREDLEEWSEEIQQAINDHDLDQALNLVHIFDIPQFTP